MAGNLEFGGEESFRSPPTRVFEFLTDLDALARTIPDLTTSQRVGPGELHGVVRPGFSFLRGTLKLKIVLGELVPPHVARMQVAAQGIGVGMQIVSELNLTPDPLGGTRLLWQARVEQLSGLIASVSPALVRAAADQVVRHTWQLVRRELAET